MKYALIVESRSLASALIEGDSKTDDSCSSSSSKERENCQQAVVRVCYERKERKCRNVASYGVAVVVCAFACQATDRARI
nr:hypothetical protein CFP56_10205 [Quercus suber]